MECLRWGPTSLQTVKRNVSEVCTVCTMLGAGNKKKKNILILDINMTVLCIKFNFLCIIIIDWRCFNMSENNNSKKNNKKNTGKQNENNNRNNNNQ